VERLLIIVLGRGRFQSQRMSECAQQQEPLLTAEERLTIAEGEVVRLRQRLLAQA
jgi:hypothetical protein